MVEFKVRVKWIDNFEPSTYSFTFKHEAISFLNAVLLTNQCEWASPIDFARNEPEYLPGD